jgi:hypothetical protein
VVPHNLFRYAVILQFLYRYVLDSLCLLHDRKEANAAGQVVVMGQDCLRRSIHVVVSCRFVVGIILGFIFETSCK